MYLIRFDMRAPAFGAATTDLYAAAIDMSSRADQRGRVAARGYAKWNPDNDVSAGISAALDVTELGDKFKSHRIIQTVQAIDFVRSGGMLNLKRVGDVVLPEAARTAGDSSDADGLSEAFTELMSTKEV